MFVTVSTWLIGLIFFLVLCRIAYSLLLEMYTILKYYQDNVRISQLNFLHKKFGSNTSMEFRKNILKIAKFQGNETELKNGILNSHMLVNEKNALKDVGLDGGN